MSSAMTVEVIHEQKILILQIEVLEKKQRRVLLAAAAMLYALPRLACSAFEEKQWQAYL